MFDKTMNVEGTATTAEETAGIGWLLFSADKFDREKMGSDRSHY